MVLRGITSLLNHKSKSEIFNLGHFEIMSVRDLADIVYETLELKNVEYHFTGSKRGWIGDSPLVHLDISKAKSYGWEPKTSIKKGIKNTINYLNQDIKKSL